MVAVISVNFTSTECDQIIDDAVNKYLQKKCMVPSSTQQKKRHYLLSDSNDSDEEDLKLVSAIFITQLLWTKLKHG